MKNPVELIIEKRNGNALTKEEMKNLVTAYINKEVPAYQMSAFLMSIFFKGMETEEIVALTDVYINSGKRIDFPKTMSTVDKHSTGGVGDKITLMLAPIVAACGATIPMISGRGLGHTGGTLDKLESIPGFRTDFNDEEFRKIIEKIGFCIISQSEELVPADKHIYALRDVTGTVESLPLITASIMSKKIAEGAQNLVIDLKVGAGAFMKNIEIAKELGHLLALTGREFGQKVSVVYTNMNSPLGEYIGNGLEVLETIEYLKGKDFPDVDKITRRLAIEMLLLAEVATTEEEAAQQVDESIKSGAALEKFREFIKEQGGNPDVCDDTTLLPMAKFKVPVIANNSGYIKEINSQGIGYALVEIDAGRKTLESPLNYGTGAQLFKKIGDQIAQNEVIGYVYSDNEEKGKEIANRIFENYCLTQEMTPQQNVILDIERDQKIK